MGSKKALCAGIVLVALGASCGGSGGSPGGEATTHPDTFSSEEQTALMANFGPPDYLNIVLDPAAGKREEAWTYVSLRKIYVFWDGARVSEESIALDSTAGLKPPKTSPRLFPTGTRKADVLAAFGDGFEADDQSVGSLRLETWIYRNSGLAVSFVGDDLVSVRTLDRE